MSSFGVSGSRLLAGGELLVAAALWGFGFVASVWALREIGAVELTFIRFLAAALLLAPAALFRSSRNELVLYARLSFVPAVLLLAALVTQTWGLQFTTATKSGFITTLYVVIIPFVERGVDGRSLPRAMWSCVVVSFVGTALIVNLGLKNLNVGDLLTLACAFFAAGQIYMLGRASSRVTKPILFNFFQSAWAGILCLPVGMRPELWTRLWRIGEWPMEALAGLLSLALGSTVIAFSLQVRAQTRLSPTVSGLLFLLESPFAMVFAMIFLGERLGPLEWLGAGLIFLSAAAAALFEGEARK